MKFSTNLKVQVPKSRAQAVVLSTCVEYFPPLGGDTFHTLPFRQSQRWRTHAHDTHTQANTHLRTSRVQRWGCSRGRVQQEEPTSTHSNIAALLTARPLLETQSTGRVHWLRDNPLEQGSKFKAFIGITPIIQCFWNIIDRISAKRLHGNYGAINKGWLPALFWYWWLFPCAKQGCLKAESLFEGHLTVLKLNAHFANCFFNAPYL